MDRGELSQAERALGWAGAGARELEDGELQRFVTCQRGLLAHFRGDLDGAEKVHA